jgi:hypothetical protein
MSRRVALVRTDVSEEPISSFIRVTSVRRLLVAASVVPSSPILVTLMKDAPDFPETSVLTRATLRNIPEDPILHSHRRENLKSYICDHQSASELFRPRTAAACEASAHFFALSAQRIAMAVNPSLLDRSRYYFIQVVPQLSFRG